MRRVTTAEELEAIVGAPRDMVLMKAVGAIDEGCRIVLANSPIAAFGYRAKDGATCSTLVGGVHGFAEVKSPTEVAFELAADDAERVADGGVSMIFFLPGVGETLRLNGTVQELAGTRLVLRVDEAFVHCAKCILRSGLWKGPAAVAPETGAHPLNTGERPALLGDADVLAFLTEAPFAIVSSWDSSGSSDTSPKGDHPGFVRPLDDRTLVIPDRKGNQRTDTFHNLMTCPDVSFAAIVPGRHEMLHLSGKGYVTDAPSVLETMAVNGRAPKLGLVIDVERAGFRTNAALEQSNVWDPASHLAPGAVPDLMGIAAQHLKQNTQDSSRAMRMLSRTFAAAPKLVRRVAEAEYRKDLRDEGRTR